ncbi:carboxymuconolactone decarboxylase family protein [Thiosocius teredinicola]|uniref:carboxymuconolactone decarboxylase family protein n=1 Tax=Thiosocius teredinicola TaxID=1973002 RepID=UPI000F78F1FC
MTRISPVSLNDIDKATADVLSGVRKKLGVLPNIFTTFAHAPAALRGYLALNESLAGGALTARQRESIAIAVAQENACEYCLSAHAAIGKGQGLNDADIAQARIGGAQDPTENLITAFALKLVRSKGELDAEEFAVAKAAGLSDRQIVEIIAHVALNVMTNYLNKVAGTAVDFPLLSLDNAA